GYGGSAQAELDRVTGHIQLQQLMRSRLPSRSVAPDMLTRRRRHGDGRKVVHLKDTPRLIVDARRLIAPAEVARPFPRIQPEVRSPGRMITVGIAQRRGEGQNPLTHLEVITDKVTICQILPSPRNGERIPVEG